MVLDWQNQSVVQATWTKILKIIETLLRIHVLLDLAVLVCIFEKFYSPPPWLWMELQVFVYPSTLIIWSRLFSTVRNYKLRSPQIKRYIWIFVFSLISLGFASNLFVWSPNLAFPLLSITYIVQLVSDICLPGRLRRKRSACSSTQNRLHACQKQMDLSQQGMAKLFRQKKQMEHYAPVHFPRRVIICCSPTDERFVTQLRTHLQPKIRQGYITLWDSSQIRSGVSQQEERTQAITSADVAVVLASADLIASDSFACEDLPQLLHRARSKKMCILLIHISACDLEGSGLENFRTINSPTKPLAGLGNPEREEIWKSTKQVICQLAGIYA